jgi:hypothetical protein
VKVSPTIDMRHWTTSLCPTQPGTEWREDRNHESLKTKNAMHLSYSALKTNYDYLKIKTNILQNCIIIFIMNILVS